LLKIEAISHKMFGSGVNSRYICHEEGLQPKQMTFFQSTYECKIDGKGRILLPAKFKGQLLPSGGEGSQELVIRRGFDKCLEVYSTSDFQRKFSGFLGLNDFDEEQRKLKRSFLAGTKQVEMDNSGRFVIPASLLEYAEVEKDGEVIMAGVGSYIEIWNSKHYDKSIFPDSELASLGNKFINNG